MYLTDCTLLELFAHHWHLQFDVLDIHGKENLVFKGEFLRKPIRSSWKIFLSHNYDLVSHNYDLRIS